MTRFLLVGLCVLLFAVAVWGMRVGWRHRSGRQGDLPELPRPPADLGGPLAEVMSGVYVGTAFATSWQDRVVARGLGPRSNASASLTESGVLIDREGADAIFLPVVSIVDARLAPGLAGKVVGAGGLLVIRWRLGDTELDSGMRGDDKSIYASWVHTINAKVKAVHG